MKKKKDNPCHLCGLHVKHGNRIFHDKEEKDMKESHACKGNVKDCGSVKLRKSRKLKRRKTNVTIQHHEVKATMMGGVIQWLRFPIGKAKTINWSGGESA